MATTPPNTEPAMNEPQTPTSQISNPKSDPLSFTSAADLTPPPDRLAPENCSNDGRRDEDNGTHNGSTNGHNLNINGRTTTTTTTTSSLPSTFLPTPTTTAILSSEDRHQRHNHNHDYNGDIKIPPPPPPPTRVTTSATPTPTPTRTTSFNPITTDESSPTHHHLELDRKPEKERPTVEPLGIRTAFSSLINYVLNFLTTYIFPPHLRTLILETVRTYPLLTSFIFCQIICSCVPLGILLVGACISATIAVSIFMCVSLLVLGPVVMATTILGVCLWGSAWGAFLVGRWAVGVCGDVAVVREGDNDVYSH